MTSEKKQDPNLTSPNLTVDHSLIAGLVGLLFLVACSDPFQVSDSLGEWGGEGVVVCA